MQSDMEARQTLRVSAAPKGMIVLVAICVAGVLAAGGAVLANSSKDSAVSKATVQGTVHAAPGSVLRQDNPVQLQSTSSISAPDAAKHGHQRGGAAEMGDSTVPSSAGDRDFPKGYGPLP